MVRGGDEHDPPWVAPGITLYARLLGRCLNEYIARGSSFAYLPLSSLPFFPEGLIPLPIHFVIRELFRRTAGVEPFYSIDELEDRPLVLPAIQDDPLAVFHFEYDNISIMVNAKVDPGIAAEEQYIA